MEAIKLNKRIKALGTKTAKWRDEVQLCLVGCVYQAIAASDAAGKLSHNIDPCIQIVKVLRGADVAAVINWLEVHAGVIWHRAEEKFSVNKSFKGEYDAMYLLGKAWWERAIKPSQVKSSIDFMEQLGDFIKRMEREVKKNDKEIAHLEVLREVKALKGALEAAKIVTE